MSLVSIFLSTLSRSQALWDKYDFDCTLHKGDHLSKFTGQFRYLMIENLSQEFLIENSSVNVELLKNMTGEIAAGAYLLSIVEIVNSLQKIGTGALLIVTNYVLGLILGNDSIYLFDFHSKVENGSLSSAGTAVLLQFDNLLSLENDIRPLYYNAYSLTLYFQMQFINLYCTVNVNVH